MAEDLSNLPPRGTGLRTGTARVERGRGEPLTDEERAVRHSGRKEKVFDGLEYTRKRLKRALLSIQDHASDGSALEHDCGCIQEKHLLAVMDTASEGVPIAEDVKEKQFYQWLAPWADATLDHVWEVTLMNDKEKEETMYRDLADDTRELRLEIEHGSFDIPNPARKRAYLPHGLTVFEKEDPEIRSLLSRCIRKLEVKCCGGPTSDYSKCSCNPVAVCRASVER